MGKLKKDIFLGIVYVIVCVLGIIRCMRPEVVRPDGADAVVAKDDTPAMAGGEESGAEADSVAAAEEVKVAGGVKAGLHTPYTMPRFKDAQGNPLKNKIYSVASYREAFPDLQDVQIVAARRWGVSPVKDREQAERRKNELVYVGSNPYYTMDSRMSYSIPYLVPRAGDLLQKISRNFLDSLAVKDIPLHTLIVTSVLRTEQDVRRLRRFNGNASEESCHRFGTTFDICYNRYNTVSHPDGPERRAVRNDSLKWVLSEVLRDVRAEGLCYVKYEVKQGCFHITVR